MGQSRSFKICVVPTARVARCAYTAQQPLYGLWNTFLFSSQIALYCYYRFCAISGTEKTLAKRWMASVLPRRDTPRHRTLPTPSTRCHGKRNRPECPRSCGAAGCGSPPSRGPRSSATSPARPSMGKSPLAVADVGWTQHYCYDSVRFCCQKDVASLLKDLFLSCGM